MKPLKQSLITGRESAINTVMMQFYWQYCSGQQSIVSSRRAWQRLDEFNGRISKYYGSYSNAQLQEALPYMLGGRPASLPSEIANSNLYVLFGNNPSSTRPSGGGKGYQIDMAVTKHMPKVIVIDPAFTDTAATKADQWIPIRPGTDAALVAALAYQWINKNQVDQDFLDKYCVGYDEKNASGFCSEELRLQVLHPWKRT